MVKSKLKKVSHTRLIFFCVLAIILAIVTLSASLQILSERALTQLFTFCTIFSVGIITLDILGIFGGHSDDGGDIGGDAGSADFDVSADVDLDLDMDLDSGGDFDAGDGIDIEALDQGGPGIEAGDVYSAHLESGGHKVLQILSYVRLLIYFCLGFGPTGWAGILTGRSALLSLGLAIPAGLVALWLAQAFFRFQRSDTDSSIRPRDLLQEQATVTIPLTDRTMGRVRIQTGMSVIEQCALAATPNAAFHKGDHVRVVRVTDDCVYVS